MPEPLDSDSRPSPSQNSNRARDHLANERTFLAWVRTGVAIVVFGFAIGRFLQIEGRASHTAGFSVWFGTIAIIAGVLLTLAGLNRYRRTRDQLESGTFEPAGFVVDLVAIITTLFGLALAGYLVYIELRL